jgi:hypothetical protein
VDGAGAAGVLFPPVTGTPVSTGEITGAPGFGAVAGYDTSWSRVFGVSAGEIESMATVRISGAQALPNPVPTYGLVVVQGDHTVTAAHPLMGTGMLVVEGNLTIEANSGSYFNGFIYVTGNYAQSAPSMIRGAAVVGGTAHIEGSADFSELIHDQGVMNELALQIGTYRISRSLHRLDTDAIGGVR